MANGQGSIDEIIGQQAIKQVEDFTVSLKKLTDEMSTALKIANDLNSATGLKSVSAGVAGVDNAIKKTKEYTLTIAAQAVEQSRVRSELKNTAKEISDNIGAYGNLEAQYKRLEKAARDAGVQFGMNSKQFKDLAEQSNKALNQIKAIDSQLGNARRNVGNYGQAVYSLSQVFRELPSFAYSSSQGILAISNNLPILADQFKLVRAEAGSTMAALKIFGASIFSLTNIFTFAISALTIWMARSEMAKNKIKEAKEATDSYISSVADEITKLNLLISLSKNENIERGQRLKYAKQLQELYPTYLGNLDKEKILAGDIADAYNRLSVALVQKSVYEGLTGQANELGKKVAPLVVELDKIQRQIDAISGKKGVSINGYQVSGVQTAEGKNRVDELEESAQKLRAQIAPLNMEMKRLFELAGDYANDLTGNVVGKKGGSTKETNRIEGLRKEYEMQRMIIENSYRRGLLSEAQYLTDLMKLDETWGKKKLDLIVNLSKAEKAERVKLENEILKNIESNFKKLEELGEKIKRALKEAARGNVEGASDNINANAQDYQQTLNALVTDLKSGSGTIDLGTDYTETLRKLEEMLTNFREFYSEISGAINDIAAISFANEMSRLDVREKRLKEYYDNEKRFIEQSGYSSAQKTKMQQKLDAETEAKRKQIDRDRITALRKQATFEKVLHIGQAIADTALAVVRALKDDTVPYPVRIGYAIAAGVAGAAQVARIAATPLPQYAKGRKGGKKEWAVVGEAGQEAIVHNGRVELTPNKPTVTLLPEGASVIPNHELIKNAAYVHLAKQGTVTTDKLQAALIESYERNTKELQQIKAVLIDKNFSFTNNELSGYESYRQSKVQ